MLSSARWCWPRSDQLDADILPESLRSKEIVQRSAAAASRSLCRLCPVSPAREPARTIRSHHFFRVMEEVERRIITGHARAHRLESDGSRGAVPDSAFHTESEDQAAGHRSAPPGPRRRYVHRFDRQVKPSINPRTPFSRESFLFSLGDFLFDYFRLASPYQYRQSTSDSFRE